MAGAGKSLEELTREREERKRTDRCRDRSGVGCGPCVHRKGHAGFHKDSYDRTWPDRFIDCDDPPDMWEDLD